MSIRAAKFSDYWRAALRRDYAFNYSRLEYSGIKCLHDDSLTFAKGITAIVGGNGVGKSTLAHAVVDVLAGAEGLPQLRENALRLDGGLLNATLGDSKNPKLLSLRLERETRTATGTTEGLRYGWCDPSAIGTLCQKQVLGDPTFADLLEGLTPRTLTPEELASSSYVVGKDYSNCKVWEISEYGPFELWPYFEIESGGVLYRSENMGRGELAVLIALWAISSAPKNSLLIVEEPETHVSARSQSALMDMMAWACAQKGIEIILTTHSPVILQKLPIENIRLLATDAGRSRLISLPNMQDVAAIVGGGVAFKTLLLVEDECAKYFVLALLEQLAPDLRRQCSIAVMNGESRISLILSGLPLTKDWTLLIGCYDGDQRARLDASGFHWPHIFLPGTSPPDAILKECIVKLPATDLAAELHLTPQTVTAALSAVAGLDPHDWLSRLPNALNRGQEELLRAMVRLWLHTDKTDGPVFIKTLKAAFV